MQASRLGVVALVAGSVLTMIVFLVHPSHVSERDLSGGLSLSQIVHATAIVAAPLLLFGLWELTRWIARPLARLGLAAAAIALVLSANAAVISSFVTPAAGRASMAAGAMAHGPIAAPAASPSSHPPMNIFDMPPLVQVTVSLNRGLAQAHVTLLSMALLLFGLALWPRSRALSLAGILVGAAPLLWQLSGTFSPETGTMPFVVFPQCAWLIAAALLIAARPEIERNCK